MRLSELGEKRYRVSRRGFLKGALLSGAALTAGARLAMAEQFLTGKVPTIESIRGNGVPPGLVRMSLNENPIGPSPRAIQAIADHMFEINRYGMSQMELIRALAEVDRVELPKMPTPPQFGQGGQGMSAPPQPAQSGQPVPPRPGQSAQGQGDMEFFRGPRTPYFISAGSSQILELLCLAYLSNGGEVIEAELGYGDISRTAESFKREMQIPTNVVSVPMTKDYRHDLNAMLKAITPKTTMVVITNPNNPTGTLLSYDELAKFVAAVPKHVLVVIDEAYIHFAKDPNYQAAIPLAVQNENVVVVRTFSKVYAMPAMRLGYAVCSPAIQKKLNFYMTGGPNMLAIRAGIEAVRDEDHIQRSRQAVLEFRERCYKEFAAMGLEYIPSESNFMMVNLKRDSREIVREMGKRKVMITRRGGDKMSTWIRVSSGTMPETEVFLETLKSVLKGQAS